MIRFMKGYKMKKYFFKMFVSLFLIIMLLTISAISGDSTQLSEKEI